MKPMKVVAINASARTDGNTAIMLRQALRMIEQAGIETELIQFGPKPLAGCNACYTCFKHKDRRCAVTNDAFNGYLEKILAADGLLLGSPTYFADVTANMKAFIERAGMVARANGSVLRRKVGAGVVAVRRGGSIHAFNTLNQFFLINEMVIPGSSYWNIGFGREAGEVQQDTEAMHTMEDLGRNMAWLLQRLAD